MLELDVVNIENKKVGKARLDERIFGADVNKALIHEAVVMQRASMRQGTVATKTRGLVRGGGKKPWRQKGTGRARHGSTRSPIWKGGGTVFGPQPRSFGYAFPKKKYRAALRGALADKFQNKEMIVLDQLELAEPKTKPFVRTLKSLGLSKKTLIVVDEISKDLVLSSRNVPTVSLVSTKALNVYDLISHVHLIVTQQALTDIYETWK
jgi:large subunit ribosomal protein L4